MGGRNARGQFMKGVTGNPRGRPKEHGKYLEMMRKAVTPTKWKAIVERAIKDACKGDKAARQWLANYLLGKPGEFITQTIDVTGAMSLADWREQAKARREEVECL